MFPCGSRLGHFKPLIVGEQAMFSFRNRRRPARSNSRRARPRLETLEERALLSTYTVNLATDAGTSTGAFSGDIRYCINQANSDAARGVSDTISFAPSVNTITLTQGKLDLTATTGSAQVTIDGGGKVTVSGGDVSTVFQVEQGASVLIAGLTITHGNSNGVSYQGGGISISGGTATLNNCTLSGNSSSIGGAILVENYLTYIGTATLNNCILSGNSSPNSYGGGIFILGSTATLNNCTLYGNSAFIGGGICMQNQGRIQSTAILNNCTLSENTASYYGGGIVNYANDSLAPSTVVLDNCTLFGNSAGPFGGGGIFNDYGTATLANCTLSGNSANNGGGGIRNYVGTVTLNNSIVANSLSGGDIFNANYWATLQGSNNLVGDGSGLPGWLSGDPRLGPLQDNGGPTQTLALLPGSPAIDAGDNSLIPTGVTTDQRGFSRIVNKLVDLGAFEVQSVNLAGTVVFDANQNGSADAGEHGVAGLVVFADINNNGILDAGEPSAVTDAQGHYELLGLTEGHTYTISLVGRSDFAPTGPTQVMVTALDGQAAPTFTGVSFLNSAPIFIQTEATPSDPNGNRAFVLGLYHDLLGRDGSTDAGVNGWVGVVDGGAARSDVVRGMFNSAEYRGRQVDHFYQAFLGRHENAAEQGAWVNYLQHGGTEEEVVATFLSSGEYQAKFADNATFVRSLYDCLLFRGASDAEVASWVNDLNAGASRADVVRGFLHSQEASLRAVDAVYAGFLRREADPAGEAGFASSLQRPDGKASDVMLAVLSSNEYRDRFPA
jgi:hypothetical protein